LSEGESDQRVIAESRTGLTGFKGIQSHNRSCPDDAKAVARMASSFGGRVRGATEACTLDFPPSARVE
jgi:hypothetical protein